MVHHTKSLASVGLAQAHPNDPTEQLKLARCWELEGGDQIEVRLKALGTKSQASTMDHGLY